MPDIHITAANIAHDWPHVVGKLPQPIIDAIDAFEATVHVVAPFHKVDAAKVTPENAEHHVVRLTESLVTAAKWEEARSRLLRALAGRILFAAGPLVPEIIEGLQPQFEAATAEFSEAFAALPEDVSADALVTAGPAILAEFHRALDAQRVISRIDSWLDRLHDLPEFAGHKRDQTLRVLKPTNRPQMNVLAAAVTSPASGPLNRLYATAVREGIGFEMHTPHEAAAVRRGIEAQPVERQPAQMISL